MSTDSTDLDILASQAYTENKDILVSLNNAVISNERPEANEFLRDQGSNKKIKRPPNSYIIYTILLNKYGLLAIIRKFCEKHKINKQKLVPISKKISKTLWNELSIVHKNIFSDLALEVEKEHKILYPDYKYQPKRKPSNYNKFRPYDPNESKIKPVDYISSPINSTSAHVPVTTQDESDEFDEQMDEDIYEDYEDLNAFYDGLPKFPTYDKEPPLL